MIRQGGWTSEFPQEVRRTWIRSSEKKSVLKHDQRVIWLNLEMSRGISTRYSLFWEARY